MYTSVSLVVRRLLLAMVLAAGAGFASADTIHIELNTSAYSSSGWLDLQFNPASVPASSATAIVSNLVGIDTSVAAQLTGDVSKVGSSYVFGNTTDWNDLFQSVTLGGTVSFDLNVTGATSAALAEIESQFSVSLYAADGMTLLGNTAANGTLLSVSFVPTTGAVAVVTTDASIVNATAVTAVPEPSTWLMLGAGLTLVGLARRRNAA
jgi:hypothetical protein